MDEFWEKEWPSLHRNRNHGLKFGYFETFFKKNVSNSKIWYPDHIFTINTKQKGKNYGLPVTRHENSDRRR